jgi:hypothetical protein
LAWLHRARVDKELANGTPSWTSPRHAARALQLTSRRHRTALAQGLDRVLSEARRRPTANFKRTAYVAPCRRSVLHCAPLLEDLSALLAGGLPLDPEPVARLRVLARDGIGPLYCGGRCQELEGALNLISASIVAED